MATILTSVNRPTGNYEDIFLYEMNVSFQALSTPTFLAKITFFVPDYFEIFLGDIELPVQEIIPTPAEGGTLYTLDFGEMQNIGLSIRIGFALKFLPQAITGDEFTFSPSLWIDEIENAQTPAETITLVVTPRYEISERIVLPTSAPSAGSFVYYLVTLQNFGDLGGIVENIDINIAPNSNLVIDETFAIVGEDKSTGIFTDSTANGIVGTVSNNVISFEIPSYRGEIYQFLYRIKIAENIFTGESEQTLTTWSIDEIAQENSTSSVIIGEENKALAITLYGADYTLANQPFAYEIKITNSGNQVVENPLFTVTLGQEVQYDTLQTGIYEVDALEETLNFNYEIFYTSLLGESGTLGVFNSSINSTVDLSTILNIGDNLSTLQWNFNEFRIGASEKTSPRLLGTVLATAEIGETILTNFNATWQDGLVIAEENANKTTVIDNISVLLPSFKSSTNNNPVRPNETIRYTIVATTRKSHLPNAIFAVILPKQLEYIGNETFTFANIFGQPKPTLPPVTKIENWNANGDTLIKFAFENEYSTDFPQASNAQISFNTKVKVGSTESFSTFALLNALEGDNEIPDGVAVYRDLNDIAGDGEISKEYAKSNTFANGILFFVATTTQKFVKGMLDDEYKATPEFAQTLQGGQVDYLLRIGNVGNVELNQLEVIDILPYIGDNGIIQTTTPRNSEFGISLSTEVVAKIQPQNEVSGLKILYTQSTDPLRFGENFTEIGTVNDWNETPPENLLEISGIKIISENSLLPTESLEIQIKGFAPVGVSEDTIAYNTFATRAFYENTFGETKEMLAIETSKVGTLVEPLPDNKGEISGFAWFDENGNSLPENKESHINDVGVVLYNSSGIPLRAVFTGPTATGELGYYAFSGVDYDKYYVRFFIANDIYRLTEQRLDIPNGSVANKTTGVSNLITVSEQNRFKNANVGLLLKNQHTLNEILKVNRSARSTLRNVVYNQMLLTMKHESTSELIKSLDENLKT